MNAQAMIHGKYYYIQVRGAEGIELKAMYHTGGYFTTIEQRFEFAEVVSFREA